jgi:hypothetical protein
MTTANVQKKQQTVQDRLAVVTDLGWPSLSAVVKTPVLTGDGRYLTRPGYDGSTRLLIDIEPGWPELPDHPTLEDARVSIRRLLEHLRHFPWASESDRSVALSLMLTAVLRPTLPTAPLHAVDSPEAGTGKSLLVDAASILATGLAASVLEYGSDATEAAKRVDSARLAGDAVIALDNIEAPLEGAALCQALTQANRRMRMLGSNAMITVPCSALFSAWHNAMGDAPVTGRNLVEQAANDRDLHDALAAVASTKDGKLSARSFSYWLRSHKDARSGEYLLQAGGKERKGTVLWNVKKRVLPAEVASILEELADKGLLENQEEVGGYRRPPAG